MEKITVNDLKDIVIGATFLGSGGGGSPENGLKLVEEISKLTKELTIVSPEEIPDNDRVAMIAGMGSPVALKEKGFGPEAIYAFEGLQRLYGWLGVDFKYIMPGETGGFNTITPMYVAAAKKLTIVDADGTGGRAVPDLETTLYYIYGIPTSPFVLADRNGNIVIGWTRDPMDAPTCENVARGVTVAFGMLSGLGTWVVTGYQIKTCLEPNVVAKSRSIGKVIREAKKKRKDPVREVLEVVKGYELIRGKIEKIETKTIAGFDFGRTTIKGSNGYEGKKLMVDFKNENMIAWRAEGEPAAMVPDLIALMTPDGNPLTNADTKEGMKISVVAMPASDKWRKHPKCFEPWRPILEKIGYKGNYVPLEKLQR
jgi:DUF917 family protein